MLPDDNSFRSIFIYFDCPLIRAGDWSMKPEHVIFDCYNDCAVYRKLKELVAGGIVLNVEKENPTKDMVVSYHGMYRDLRRICQVCQRTMCITCWHYLPHSIVKALPTTMRDICDAGVTSDQHEPHVCPFCRDELSRLPRAMSMGQVILVWRVSSLPGQQEFHCLQGWSRHVLECRGCLLDQNAFKHEVALHVLEPTRCHVSHGEPCPIKGFSIKLAGALDRMAGCPSKKFLHVMAVDIGEMQNHGSEFINLSSMELVQQFVQEFGGEARHSLKVNVHDISSYTLRFQECACTKRFARTRLMLEIPRAAALEVRSSCTDEAVSNADRIRREELLRRFFFTKLSSVCVEV